MSDGVIIHAKPEAKAVIYAGVGTPGAPGATWYVGSADPSTSIGVNGDLFLNTTGWNILRKQGGVWVNQGNIKGSNGGDGNGITAITQPSPDIMRVATRDLAPVDITLVSGNNGTNGATWYISNSAPSNGTGVNGDLHVNTTSWQVSVKQSGSWVSQGSIKGENGAAGPTSIEPFIDAPEELEHFRGFRGVPEFSQVFGVFVNSGGSIGQATTDVAALKSISVVRNLLTPSGSNPLTLFRKAAIFLPTYNTAKNDFLFELGFAIPQLPTSGENFQVEVSAINAAVNTSFGNVTTGIAARLEFNASVGRAAFVLETKNGGVSSTAIATTSVAINTLYKIRIRLNQPSNTAQLLVNGTVVATLATNLPTGLLMKRILFLKTAGTGTVECYYSYHYERISYI
jgi:hypothetical protein